ncbi:LysM peptidoglycan-binding domain-containing protein [uncultured Clostridium sp.]|uniref:LysM peptidoglycan-binding domain-containing protein n=1 Tax=uncultured Clostridium sp. TaxID=59620 RepID=UPI0027DB53BD|nr:LysM peptidoglycan-binding domain-containing protein [uncultured Clostridium sp.]
MAYKFYMDKVLLPVPPSKMTTKISNKNKTVTLINDGEVSILKSQGLTEISFDLLLPNVEYPFADYKNGKFKEAKYFLDKFEKLKLNKTSFQFIVSRELSKGKDLFSTNITVSLEDYSIIEDAKEGFDVTASIKLKQYKLFSTKVVQLQTTIAASSSSGVIFIPAKEETPPKVNTSTIPPYTVKSGDCLWNICKRFLGDGSKYSQIAKLNNISNPNLIYPGQVIRFS